MFASHIGLMPAHAHSAPPHWAVLSVKCCVVGILTFPLVVPLLLAAIGAAVGVADPFSRAVFFSAVGLWMAMFAMAQYLITVYPPVRRQ